MQHSLCYQLRSVLILIRSKLTFLYYIAIWPLDSKMFEFLFFYFVQFSCFLQTNDHVVVEINDMANVEKIHVKSSDFVTTLITLKLSDYL